jgi:glutaredoxin
MEDYRMKFYSNNCPRCRVLKKIMDEKGMEYTLISDIDVIYDVAEKANINSMPFAEVDGKILSTTELQEYINK